MEINLSMLFNTIKNTTISTTVIALAFVCTSIVYLSLQEYEKLYRTTIAHDLQGLSENFANDLIPLIANDIDDFELTTQLLKLDVYDNIVYAIVFDTSWQQIQAYKGKAFLGDSDAFLAKVMSYNQQNLGLTIQATHITAVKRIGDEGLPVGYLLIASDFYTPLKQSKTYLLERILPFAIFVVVFVIIISLFIQQRLFAPLMRLSELAKKIQKTKDYSLRINVKGTSEVAELSHDINTMMETINRETRKNLKYTEQLKQQQQAMEKLANFDTLTGLPNRKFFMETLRGALSQASHSKHDLILFYLDLDEFKNVNDSLGHETGDHLLICVCERIKSLLGKEDVASRLGGDEFLILLTEELNNTQLIELANKIVSSLSNPFSIKSWNVQIGASLGIAKASDSNFNLSEFISNADIAMYRSKLAGKGTTTLFTPDMMEDNKRKLLVANSINAALNNNELSLNYQAKVSATGNVVGYEALVRWRNDELGFVSPAEFIPIAEQSGKIISITRWILQQACEDIHDIQKFHEKKIIVSLNLSALDIKNTSLIAYIQQLFTEYRIEPHWFEFEVTESAYLENFDMANQTFETLRKMGSSIALDDFGTGYSSLGYLTQIHLNTLKIDKQFVDNINISSRSTLITKTIIDMAKHLNLKICAEGVETREQADFLIEHGCDELQGFLFAKPVNLKKIATNRQRE